MLFEKVPRCNELTGRIGLNSGAEDDRPSCPSRIQSRLEGEFAMNGQTTDNKMHAGCMPMLVSTCYDGFQPSHPISPIGPALFGLA